MSFVFALLALASAPVSSPVSTIQDAMATLSRKGLPRGAVPLGNPGDWVRPDDYPSTAVIDQSEGAVSFELQVDRDGKVSACQVTVSSGVASLDDATCNLITVRALFDPARDAKGKAIASTYRNRVVWKMNDPHPAMQPGRFSTSFVVEVDGTVSDCRVEGTQMDAVQIEKAKRACARETMEAYTDDAGNPVRRRVTMTMTTTVDPVK
jgi:protein TonB